MKIPGRFSGYLEVSASKVNPDVALLPTDIAMVLRYWEKRRGDAFAPAWRDFDMSGFPAWVISLAVVVDILREPLDFVYRYWCPERTRLHGRDYTGASIFDVEPHEINDKVAAEYHALIEERAPLLFISRSQVDPDQADGKENAAPIRFKTFRLPLSDDGENVTHAFAIEFDREGDDNRLGVYRHQKNGD